MKTKSVKELKNLIKEAKDTLNKYSSDLENDDISNDKKKKIKTKYNQTLHQLESYYDEMNKIQGENM